MLSFKRRGVAAYAELQLAREKMPLRPGTAFEVTRRLLALNQPGEPPLVRVVLLSKNSPDLSLWAFYCFEHQGLPIIHGSFTSGRSVALLVLA
jgi:5'-nucleotidase